MTKRGRKVRGVFERDGQWWIRWSCSLGHDHRQPSGESKTAAGEEHKAKRAEVRDARKAGRQCCPKLVHRERPALFEQILADYMEHSRRNKRSHASDRPKEERFTALFRGRLASDITSKEIEDFKAAFLQEPRKPRPRKAGARRSRRRRAQAQETGPRTVATVNSYLKFLKAVFNRAIRQGRLTYNPVKAVKLYRENNARSRCLSQGEERRLLEALPERLRPFVTLALHTGMRRGELRALKWEDVDFSTGAIHVKQDKAGDGRWVTVNSVAREALLSVKREQKILSPWVFCSPEGKFLHNFERDWRPALEAAKIPDFRFHDTRHTFASRLAMAGVDLYTVQRAGGWKTQVMVQRYAHLSPDHMRAAVERLANAARQGATGSKTGTAS
ncbi:MAG: site-specific integrase [Candidatus Rokubacteria bacterium]|nr:site-specific integrase [Candidatus Rokubacteria bacterium]MBI3105323.1 site-specific integrase [Candidatus Rokubacteria bacterium]